MKDELDQNLISLMVEETLEGASSFGVVHNELRSCYILSFHGYELEVPENWSAFQEDSLGNKSFPSEFLDVVGTQLSCDFKWIKILRHPLSLEVEILESEETNYLKAA